MLDVCWEHSQERCQERSNIVSSLITTFVAETPVTRQMEKTHSKFLWPRRHKHSEWRPRETCTVMDAHAEVRCDNRECHEACLFRLLWLCLCDISSFLSQGSLQWSAKPWKWEAFPASVVYSASFSLNCSPLKCSVFGFSYSDRHRTNT